jgi:hypothetical protein
MIIQFGNHGELSLKFQIKSTPVAQLWAERMNSRGQYLLDHPDRFYGFGTLEQERSRAVSMITQCIDRINSHSKIIHREFEYTQDCLNYLHSIFEQYHGLLDQQNSDYWNTAPESVQKALAELNLAVHRCESAMTFVRPRVVCTWYGMPKTKKLDVDLQKEFGTPEIKFGTVYLNYCEIGKTVEDLANDNDKYIGTDAFKPFSYYSADFNVSFYDYDLRETYSKVQQYIDQHQEFFLAHNITSVYNITATPQRFPVADLIYTGPKEELMNQLALKQQVYKVTIE